MISHEITNIKAFMNCLFSQTTFDSFYLIEATVKMGITHHIDGRINKDFYDSDQMINRDYCLWKEGKGHLFHIIKGVRLPVSMKIILGLNPSLISDLVRRSGSFREDEITGMYINILFQPDRLTLTAGISCTCFTLDKSLEDVFGAYITECLLEAF